MERLAQLMLPYIRQNCQLVPLPFNLWSYISSNLTNFRGGEGFDFPEPVENVKKKKKSPLRINPFKAEWFSDFKVTGTFNQLQ